MLRTFLRSIIAISVTFTGGMLALRVGYGITHPTPSDLDMFQQSTPCADLCWFGITLDATLAEVENALTANDIAYYIGSYSHIGASMQVRDDEHQSDLYFVNDQLKNMDVSVALCMEDVLLTHGRPMLFSINPYGTFVAYYPEHQIRLSGRNSTVTYVRMTEVDPQQLEHIATQVYRPNSWQMFDRHFRRACAATVPGAAVPAQNNKS